MELLALSNRLPGNQGEGLWVTFDDPQSRSLLAGRHVVFVRYASPRDLVAAALNAVSAGRLLRRRTFTHAFSTGASVAVSFLPLAAARGIESHYLESAARLSGPSLTGRILQRTPGVHLHCQSPAWAHGRWHYAGSVFDGFEQAAAPARALRRVVVSVGSLERFGFRRLVEQLRSFLPSDIEVLWQTGVTDTVGLDLRNAERLIPAVELQQAFAAADVVVAHAGVGTALTALSVGRCPILVPREAAFGEHVDDHQSQIAFELDRRGLACARRVDELQWSDLVAAAGRGVGQVPNPPAFDLTLARR